VSSPSAAPAGRYGFDCSACGKCCNSPPAMTLDELFHHERRFVGCITLRQAPEPVPAGARIDGVEISPATAGEARALHDALGFAHGGRHWRVASRAYDYPSLGRCPALRDDGLCAVHDDLKPGLCGVVPLEPELPDGLQRIVLHRRASEAAYFGAACIRAEGAESHVLVAGERVVDAVYRQALARQRRRLVDEAEDWGHRVAAALVPALGAAPRGRSLDAGHLTLSLLPVLGVMSSRSAEQARRCDRYARAQIELIDASIDRARARGHRADRPVTQELRRFAQHYRAFVGAG
jgi:Fe-S-cluster containining protein